MVHVKKLKPSWNKPETFLAFFETISPEDLGRKGSASAWTVKALLFHIVLSVEYVPKEVNAARKNKNLFPMPQGLYDPMIVVYTRLAAMRQNRQSLLKRFEKGYQAMIACLEGVEEAE